MDSVIYIRNNGEFLLTLENIFRFRMYFPLMCSGAVMYALEPFFFFFAIMLRLLFMYAYLNTKWLLIWFIK